MKTEKTTTEGQNSTNAVLSAGWNEVKNYDFKKCPKVIVTNNIDATDADGQMSHIWIVTMIHKEGRGRGVRYSAFNDASMPYPQQIWDVTHFMMLPSACR